MNSVRFHNGVKLYGLEGWASFMLEPLGNILLSEFDKDLNNLLSYLLIVRRS